MKSKLLFAISLLFFVFTFATASASDLFNLVPYDASIVMKVQFQNIMEEPTLKSLFSASLPAFDSASHYDVFEKAGIDPLKDIYNVVLFIDKDGRIGVLADGGFDAITTCELAQSDPEISRSFTLTAVGGLPALKSDLNAVANVVFVDQRTMAIGDIELLERVGQMAADKKIRSIKENPMFVFLERKLDVETPLVWGIGISGRSWLPSVENPVSGLDNVRATYFAFDYQENFTLDFTCLVTRSSQLQELVDSLWELLDGLKVYVSDVEGMAEILSNASIQDDRENLARVFINMPVAQFNAALLAIGAQINK